MTAFNHQQILLTCERQLGEFGAMLFRHLVGFSGLPTNRLFVWAKLMQALLHPGGMGPCGGTLSRQYISKWKSLVQLDGKTDRVTEGATLEFAVADFRLRADRQQMTVLLAFERVSETLLIYATRQASSAPMIVSKVIELEREVSQKMSLDGSAERTGKKLLWLPRQPAFQEAATNICLSSASSGSSNAERLPKRITWGSGASRFYPEDWTCDWLAAPVLPAEYRVPKGLTMAECRRQTVKFVQEFNQQAQAEMNPNGVSPSITSNIRARLVNETIPCSRSAAHSQAN